jgi:hypothetical protein
MNKSSPRSSDREASRSKHRRHCRDCSKAARAYKTSVRTSAKIQTHRAPTRAMHQNTGKAVTPKAKKSDEAKPPRFPKKLRLSLLSSFNKLLEERMRSRIRHTEPKPDFTAWKDCPRDLPITSVTKLILDFTDESTLGFENGYPLGAMRLFTKDIAMRLRTESKGKTKCLLVAPSLTTNKLVEEAGSFVRAWTWDDKDWSANKRLEYYWETEPEARAINRQ